MGDRAQVYFPKTGVYLYTHWRGHDLPRVVANALDRGRDRWNDPEYLARIVFAEMIRGDVDGDTGYGISTEQHGDVFRVVELHTSSKRVCVRAGDTVVWADFEEFVEYDQTWP